MPIRLAHLAVLVALAMLAVACNGDDPLADGDDPLAGGDPTADTDDDDGADAVAGELRIGHFDFPESAILAEVYAGALESIGVEIADITPLAQREVTFPALENGDVDVLPEYNGNTLEFLIGGADDADELSEALQSFDTDTITDALRDALADRGLLVLEASEAENRDAMVVTGETAEEFGLTTVSDLADVDDQFVVAGAIEFSERSTGLVGLEEEYGLSFADFLATDACGPQTFDALESGEAQVARLCSTDAPIVENGWVILEEDIDFTYPNNITPIVREAAVDEETIARIDEVSALLTTEVLQEFNSRFNTEGAEASTIAADFLAENGLD